MVPAFPVDDAFLAALFPGEHRILGRRLQVYCHGHLASLYACQSPFVAAAGTDAQIGAGDLILALRICQTPGFPLLTPRDLRPRLRDLPLRWWIEGKQARLRAAAESFQRYQDGHCSFPEFYRKGATAEDEDLPETDAPAGLLLSAPFVLARVCSLISRTTISEERAWRMPLALPSWYIGTMDELAGTGARFLNESEDNEDDLPEDFTQMSEADLYQQALRDLGKARADEWRKARRNTQRREKRRRKKGKPSHES